MLVAFSTIMALLAVSLLILGGPAAEWSGIQLARSVLGRTFCAKLLDRREEQIWGNWERSLLEESPALLPIPLVTAGTDLRTVDLRRPFLAKNLSHADVLTIQDLLTPPLSELKVDYFSDARRKNTVPDAFGAVGAVVARILDGGPEKFGTQMILKAFPVVMERFLDENEWLSTVFGAGRVQTWRRMGGTVTVPVFMSRGRAASGASLRDTTRTDLHCEPISNLVGQTVGEKAWTLIEPKYSHLLRPTVAPDGRAYFYSSVDPYDPSALSHVPRYEVVTQAGDVLYVPTWTWHRVQYLPEVTAVSISLFEFVPSSFLTNNPLFAVSLIPNLIKEAIGIKTQ